MNIDHNINHLAIIMDGNGRWARKNFYKISKGHEQGVLNIKEICTTTIELGIKHLTLFAFSTENWARPDAEVKFIFDLLENYIDNHILEFAKQKIRLKFVGDLSKLPDSLLLRINKAQEITSTNEELNIYIALNYGGRFEILDAVNKIIKSKIIQYQEIAFEQKKFEQNANVENIDAQDIKGRLDQANYAWDYPQEKSAVKNNAIQDILYDHKKRLIYDSKNIDLNISQEEFRKYLYQPDMPDVDLMIRTSGVYRISNFLLWHLAYAELYFSSKYWPEFNGMDLKEAVMEYATRQRNFGTR